MPKNILQDVMTSERRSIRQVPFPDGRFSRQAREEKGDDFLVYEREEETPVVTRKRSGKVWLWVIAFLFLTFLCVALLSSWSGSTVTVTPKSAPISINKELVAGNSDGAALHFNIVNFTKKSEKKLLADSTKKVSEKAKGIIVVYNNFSSSPQRLIKNTRFESPEGKIYRIRESIVIPGRKQENGKTVPGSVETEVFADISGAEYNIGLVDFTIPGFKSDSARFAGFYARSKTPMEGGMEGIIKTASDSVIAVARDSMIKEAREALKIQAQSSVSEEYVLFEGAVLYDYSENPVRESGDSVIIGVETTIYAYLFKKTELEKKIAMIAGAGELPSYIQDIKAFSFSWSGDPVAGKSEEIKFFLNGSSKIIFEYDELKFKEALLGRNKNDLGGLLSSFPAILKADVIIRPFWSNTFPEDSKRLNIKTSVDSL